MLAEQSEPVPGLQLAGGWRCTTEITGRGEHGFLAGHADLFRAGTYMCRIVLAREFADEWVATNALKSRAIDWVADWDRRAKRGDSGFADL